MIKYKKITEWQLLEYLLQTENLLSPLLRDSVLQRPEGDRGADAFLTTHLAASPLESFLFLVETKAGNTPKTVNTAISQITVAVAKRNDPDIHPMILVPYLSEDRLQDLEAAQVSGIDLCGNGVVCIPDRLYIYRTGKKNLYPESRPVSNPFKGKSAMVARGFFTDPVLLGKKTKFDTLGELHQSIENRGAKISLSQVSKAVATLEEEQLIGSQGRSIYMLDPNEMMERLATSWKPSVGRKVFLRLDDRLNAIAKLNTEPSLKWAITGESSISHYTPFSQGGPLRVAVSNIADAVRLIDGTEESVPNFADVELLETDETGYFFENKTDEIGLRWASLMQTWIELRHGDPRQQDAAQAIRDLIIAPS